MGLPQNRKQNKLPSRDPPLAETAGAISSLNEAVVPHPRQVRHRQPLGRNDSSPDA
jgi:hypothetical protein